jgi:hypothetical protein
MIMDVSRGRRSMAGLKPCAGKMPKDLAFTLALA